MFTKMWRDSVRLSSFKLNHPALEDFTICCWQKSKNPKAVWLAYRIVIGLYFLATLIYAFSHYVIDQPIEGSDKYKFYIFLTHWTYTLETFLFCLAGITTIIAFRSNKKSDEMKEEEIELPWYYKMYWFTYTTALTVSVVVTLIYWIEIYDPEIDVVTDRSLILHVFNSVLMVIDFVLVAHPIRFFHFYCPLTYSLIYLFFSMTYEFSGGTGIKGNIPIYKVLDWKEEPKLAFITTVIASSVIFFMHVLYSLLSLAKMAIRKKCITD